MAWFVGAALVVAATVVVLLLVRRRLQSDSTSAAVAVRSHEMLGRSTPTVEPVEEGEEAATRAVAVHWAGPDTAVVLGAPSDIERLGSPISALPDTVARGLVVGNAALQGVIAAGEASGQLVRLTAESARALRELQPIKDSAGAVLGVVRGDSGKFAHVVRFRPVDGIKAAVSLGPALSAVAFQLQLQQLSKQLAEIQASVRRVEAHQHDDLATKVEAHHAVALQDLEQFHATGQVSADDWAVIAGRRSGNEQNVRMLARKVQKAAEELAKVRSKGAAADRLDEIKKVMDDRKPLMWLSLYVQAQETVVVDEYLRVHRAVTTNDPNLAQVRARSEERARQAINDAAVVCRSLGRGLREAGAGNLGRGFGDIITFTSDKTDKFKKYLRGVRKQADPMIRGVNQLSKSFAQPMPALEEGHPGESDGSSRGT